MAGNTPYEAFEEFRKPLQRALSCVNSQAHLWALSSNGYEPEQDHALVPDAGEPVRLSGNQRLSLSSFFAYRVIEAEGERGPWKVETRAYFHALIGEENQEIIAYHWHPGEQKAVSSAHLHIGRGIGADLGKVHKYHLPTGRITLERVLDLAIHEFGVEPQREGWQEVLHETQTAFEEWSTW